MVRLVVPDPSWVDVATHVPTVPTERVGTATPPVPALPSHVGGSLICYVTTTEALEDAFRRVFQAPIVGVDLDTTGLDPHTDRVRLISLAVPEGCFVVDAFACPGWATYVGLLLETPTVKVMHNGQFDLSFALKAVPDTRITDVWDTMLSAQLLDGGRHLKEPGYFTLAAVTERELGERLDKSLQTSDWCADHLSHEQVAYAAKDATVLLPLHQVLMHKLEQAGLTIAAALEMAALPALAWLELTGAPFDAEQWMALSDQAMRKKLSLADEVTGMLSNALGADTPFGRRVNLDSPAQVQKALAALSIPLESTSEEALSGAAHRHPVIPKLLAYREASKLASTYGIEFLHHVHPTTGRIHANYHQVGAVTGRMSCSAPNLQQVPRLTEYRACFRPAAGRVLVKADLSLVEMCVAAELAGDRRMIRAITEGRDLHRLTAAALFGVESEAVTPDQRAFGKAVNFGTLFGQGRAGLIRLAAQHGLTLSEAQAREFQQRFAKAWPELAAWQRRQMRGASPEVRTASGRVRYLDYRAPGTVRTNTPVQGTAADGFKAALALLWETREQHPSAAPVLVVHDELVVECDARDSGDVALWVTTCLQEGMCKYLKNAPVRVEVNAAPSWEAERHG